MLGQGGSLSEKLTFLIDLNAQGAIKGFDQVGKAADQGLGKADSRLDRTAAGMTKFGAGAMAAAGVAALGLKKLADSASDYGEAVSAAAQIFGDEAVPELEKFADSAAKSAGISKTAAIDGANTFGTFGKAAGLAGKDLTGFSTQMVQLAGDLASFKNTSPEEAITAIGSALRGEAEPMRKYGVLLDDATMKQAAMEMGIYDGSGALTQQQKVLAAHQVILQQTSDAQGDFVRTSDGLANQQRQLSAEMENLKVQIGQGLTPMFSELVGGATKVLQIFTSLPAGVQAGIGSFAGWATAALGAAGAASFLIGKGIQMRDTFSKLSPMLHDAEGGLNAFGKTAAGVGTAVAALAISEAIFSGINAAAGYADKSGKAMNELAIATSKAGTSAQTTVAAFGKMSQVEDDSMKLSHLWTDFGDDLKLAGVQNTVEDAQAAFDKLFKTDPSGAAKLLDALQAENDQLAKGSEQREINQRWIDHNRDSVDKEAEATKAAAVAAADAADKQTGLGVAMDQTKSTAEQLEGALKDGDKVLADWRASADAAAAGASAFGDEIERVDTDELVSGALDLGKSFQGVRDTVGALPAVFDPAKAALGGYDEAQTKAISSVIDWGDAVKAQTESLIAQGATADQVKAQTDTYRNSLTAVMRQAGMTDAQIDTYLRTLGLTPDLVDTAIKLSGDQEARFRLQLMQGQLNKLDEGAQAEVYALIAQGEYQAALAKMVELSKPRTAEVTVSVKNQQQLALHDVKDRNDPWGRAASLGPVPGVAPYAAGSVWTLQRPVNVKIEMPAGTNGEDVIRAQRRWESRNGSANFDQAPRVPT